VAELVHGPPPVVGQLPEAIVGVHDVRFSHHLEEGSVVHGVRIGGGRSQVYPLLLGKGLHGVCLGGAVH
jgi:hypothetical protein